MTSSERIHELLEMIAKCHEIIAAANRLLWDELKQPDAKPKAAALRRTIKKNSKQKL